MDPGYPPSADSGMTPNITRQARLPYWVLPNIPTFQHSNIPVFRFDSMLYAHSNAARD